MGFVVLDLVLYNYTGHTQEPVANYPLNVEPSFQITVMLVGSFGRSAPGSVN